MYLSFIIWICSVVGFFLLVVNGYTAISPNGIGNVFLGVTLLGFISYVIFLILLFKKSVVKGIFALIFFPTLTFGVLLFITKPNTEASDQQIAVTPFYQSQSPILTNTPTMPPKPRILDGGKLFNIINAYRAKNGLSQMEWYHPLCEYSKKRSAEVQKDWSHTGYENDAKDGVLYKIDCPECAMTGENLAKDFYSEEGILQGWINSSSHKANLDGNWNWGCAMFYSNNYVSFIFGKKK